jgi:hypothetical protein
MSEQATKELTPEKAEYWKIEIDAATQRQKGFWKSGGVIVKRFLDERKSDNEDEMQRGDNSFRLNLFHSNIITQISMLFGRVPKTDVTRRWADPNDDIARVASEILKRQINLSIEAPGSTDTDLLRSCLQDRLLPGLGVARVLYEFEKEEVVEQMQTVEGIEEYPYEKVVDESAPLSYIHWRDFIWGYARVWSDVPWVGYKIQLDKIEFTERFGEEKAKLVTFDKKAVGTEEEDSDKDQDDPWMKAELYEIWCKKTRKVYWYTANSKELLDTRDDPLELKGFFPSPEPMAANTTTTLYIPRADYKIAQDLYNQIDVLQTRISIITKAVKVVGLYDAGNKDIARMFKEGTDNDLIPVSNWAMFAEKQGLKGQIDWLPLADIVNALSKLQEIRNETIELLYQVTGMSDILRGHSEQYSGVGQEVIKSKFASARIQHVQDDFARFASDLMRLRAEIITKHFEPETIYAKSSAEFLQEPPELIMSAIEMLKSDETNWMWQVEIKPESIAMMDYAQLKAERTEFLAAMGSFLNNAQAVGAAAPEMIPFLLDLMRWGLAGFKGAQQIEGTLDRAIDAINEKLKNPPPQQPNPKIEEIQAKSQAEMVKQQQKSQAEIAKQQQKSQDEMMKIFNTHKTRMQEMMADNEGAMNFETVQAELNSFEINLKHMADMELETLRQAGKTD